MNPDARRENTRTLASILGLPEKQADPLLDARVLLTSSTSPDDSELLVRVERQLKKTIWGVMRSLADSGAAPQVEVVFGEAAPRAGALVVFVLIEGESVFISDQANGRASGQPIHKILLAIAAPCICAQVAKLLFPSIKYPTPRRVRVNLRDLLGNDLDRLSEAVDVGRTDLVGAGAVGTAFIRALSDFDIRGRVRIFDDDDVSGGNLNRCDFYEEADIGDKKSDTLAEKGGVLFGHLDLTSMGIRLDSNAKKETGGRVARMVVAADSRRGRRHLQMELPLEVYDASTTGIAEIILHFNSLATSSACLSCIYKQEEVELAHEKHVAESLGVPLDSVMRERVTEEDAHLIQRKYPKLKREQLVGQAYDTLFKQLCGADMLKTSADKQVLAPFAFVSALAGSLLALEFIRRLIRKTPYQPFNFWRVSPWAGPIARVQTTLPFDPECELHSNSILMDAARRHADTFRPEV